jgi:enolase
VIGLNCDEQQAIDRRLLELDGRADKSRLGANAILGVSLAVAHAAANDQKRLLAEHLHDLWEDFPSKTGLPVGGMTIPLPMVNIISGGRHAGGNLRVQDFLIIPVGAASFRDAFDAIVEVYWEAGRELTRRGYEGVLVGDEGGYGPKLPDHETALDVIVAAIEKTGRQPGRDVAIALDIAATQFYREGRYFLDGPDRPSLSAAELVETLARWRERYPIVSIEDALQEDDWDGWRLATEKLGGRVQLIGDDLFVTNSSRVQRGIEAGVANSVLVKVNQIGTLTETFETLRLALDHGYRPVISARSGETEDATIADLAVGTGAGQIKIGSVARSERLAKYNQLLRLEERLGSRATYIGRAALAR